MKKTTILFAAALLCAVLLCGCGSVSAAPESTPTVTAAPLPTAEPTPMPTPEPTPEPIRVEILGRTYGPDSTEIDLRSMSAEELDEICEALSQLPGVESLLLPEKNGYTALDFDALDALRESAPQAELHGRFRLFEKDADFETTELRYYYGHVYNDGIETFRRALPYLSSLELLRLELCFIDDYEAMDALRSDFPEVNIVWSVFIEDNITLMTDTVLINTSLLSDRNVKNLKYMRDVLYVDFGHDMALTDLSFLAGFPKLRVLICSLTNISDLSPLAECPELEFLECFSTKVSDLSPLSGLTKLTYLNLGDLAELDDLTPLYGMDSLRLVRICGRSMNGVSEEEIAELAENLSPECLVSSMGGHSANSGYWRYVDDDGTEYTERYLLLRQQMQYDVLNIAKRAGNSLSQPVTEFEDMYR